MRVYLVTSPGAAPTKVIAGVHTPLGLVWVADTLYVASHGRVDAYTDLDGVTFGSHTTVLTLPDDVGEVNGLVMSPEGRLVLGVSAPATTARRPPDMRPPSCPSCPTAATSRWSPVGSAPRSALPTSPGPAICSSR